MSAADAHPGPRRFPDARHRETRTPALVSAMSEAAVPLYRAVLREVRKAVRTPARGPGVH
jgi:hypothetical protein